MRFQAVRLLSFLLLSTLAFGSGENVDLRSLFPPTRVTEEPSTLRSIVNAAVCSTEATVESIFSKELALAKEAAGITKRIAGEAVENLTELKNPREGEKCPSPWNCEFIPWKARTSKNIPITGAPIIEDGIVDVDTNIRAGYLKENPNVPFKGNIMYYEGLGDSMLNHGPLFKTLTDKGYRVIAFDYMGQGGSGGTMDNTRIEDIPKIADKVWNTPDFARSPKGKKTIIGWSTGGLAAFREAQTNPENTGKIVLIAPGIDPKAYVGDHTQITMETLTHEKYDVTHPDPHYDPIFPESPYAVANFALNLKANSIEAKLRPVPKTTNGFVLLSGDDDTYVDATSTENYLKKHKDQFQFHQYDNTFHEIDNESEPQGATARKNIVWFLENGKPNDPEDF